MTKFEPTHMSHPKKPLPAIVGGFIVAISIPIFAFIRNLAEMPITIEVSVFELGESGLGASFNYDLEFFINILAMTVGLNIIFWIAFKLLLQKVDGRARLKFLLEITAVLIIITSVMGVVFHWGFDRANGFYKHQYGPDTTNLYLYLYWGDEFLGHALQETTLLGYFLILVVVEQVAQKPRKIHWIDLPFMIPTIGVLAVSIGYAALISESAMLMLICASIALGVQALFIFKRKINLRESPLLLSTVIACMLVIVQHIVYIAIYGVMPWYPWLRPT